MAVKTKKRKRVHPINYRAEARRAIALIKEVKRIADKLEDARLDGKILGDLHPMHMPSGIAFSHIAGDFERLLRYMERDEEREKL